MKILKVGLLCIAVIYFIAYLVFLARTKKPLRTMFFFALAGIAAMMILNLTDDLTGISIPVNPYSVFVSAALGIPGVTALLLLKFVFL